MRFIFFLFVLFSLSSFAQLPSPVSERKNLFETLKSDLLSEKKCLGMTYQCVTAELIKLEINSSNDLSFGSNILAHVLQRKLKADGCARICQNDNHVQFMDALLTYLESFSLSKNWAYAGPLPKSRVGRMARATEDLLLYKQLESIQQKTRPIAEGIEIDKILHADIASKARSIHGRLNAVRSKFLLQKTYLKELSSEDPVLKSLMKAGGKNPVKEKEYLQLIENFRKDI